MYPKATIMTTTETLTKAMSTPDDKRPAVPTRRPATPVLAWNLMNTSVRSDREAMIRLDRRNID
jgi:hypothetical protein